ncbi:hypothetical protein J2Z50_000780 [Ensifer mexicanus]|nr:hypothetical protein [Sinorhizobium mexicanum]
MRRPDKYWRRRYWENVGTELLLTLLVAIPIAFLVLLVLTL